LGAKVAKNIGIIGRGSIGVHLAYQINRLNQSHRVSNDNLQNKVKLFIRDNSSVISPLYLASVTSEPVDNEHPVTVDHELYFHQDTISTTSLADLDLLILPVKHYQVEAVLHQLVDLLPSITPILLLHNGMGTKEITEKLLPNNPLYLGITTDGVYQVSANRFQQTAVGKLELGLVSESSTTKTERVSDIDMLKSLHPNVVIRDDIEYAQYQKLAANAVINPLTALKNCKNGELLEFKDELKAIKNEVFDLYEFMSLPIDTYALSRQIDDIITLTASNYSSMHQDYHSNRQTEVDGILGFLIEKAEDTGMYLPLISDLYKKLRER
jgi:2-dehydropantoate 2-reductase